MRSAVREPGYVIYLIGGAPRCGKTSVAQALARELGCSWLPTDYLMSAFNRYAPEHERVGQLLPGESNDVRYSRHSIEEIVQSYHRRARAASAGITSIVEYARSDSRDLILEGFHLEPWLMHDLQSRYGEVSGAVLICLDADKLVERLSTNSDPDDWVSRNTSEPATFPKIAAMVVSYSLELQGEAADLALPVVVADNGLEAATTDALERLA
jgi:2-phosphoglycerate kinase